MFPPLPPKMEFNSMFTLTQESCKILQKDAIQLLLLPQDAEALKLHISSTFIQEVPVDDVENSKQQERILHFTRFFQYSIEFYPNELALKLSQIIESSSSSEIPVVRTLCITLMHSFLSCCNSTIPVLSAETLIEVREILLYSLQQDFSTPIFPLLSTMVSTVASNVFRFDDDNGLWPEYLEYVASVLDKGAELKKGLWLLLVFPLNITRPKIMPYTDIFQGIILTHLNTHEDDDDDIWVLAFGSCFKLMFILASFPIDSELLDNICNMVKISVKNLIKQEKQVLVQKGLQIVGALICKEIWRFSLFTLKLPHDVLVYIFHDDPCMPDDTKNEVSRLLDIIRKGEHMIKSLEFNVP